MSDTKSKTIRLFVVEEQEIYRELYKSILPSMASVELLDVLPNGEIAEMNQMVSSLQPDVLLMSTKKLEKPIIAELEQIRVTYPQIGIVLLLVFYTAQDINLLRKLALAGKGGMALFLKQSLDLTEQLFGIITSVNQGQIILDPLLTSLFLMEKTEYPFLNQLTAREVEILSLLSKGYTNSSIAGALYIDVKTVEHHINSMYSKLKTAADFNDRHPRVSAARLYLEATGELLISEKLDSRLVPSHTT
jgi:DNA-binding NarL/FixJ family response regulator